jgi:hypothetical protein
LHGVNDTRSARSGIFKRLSLKGRRHGEEEAGAEIGVEIEKENCDSETPTSATTYDSHPETIR